MPYATDEDEVLGVVSNATFARVLVPADRYGVLTRSVKVVKNNFYKEGEVEVDENGKERTQNKEQYQITFALFDPKGDPDELLVDEEGNEITLTEWYSKRDDGVIGKKSRTYRLFAALNGSTELPDRPLKRGDLLNKRAIVMVTQKTGQDGKTVRNKIAKDSEEPYTGVVDKPKFGTRKAA